MKIVQPLLISFLSFVSAHAQVVEEIDVYIQSQLNDQYCKIPKAVNDVNNYAYLSMQLEKYRNDPDEDIRRKAYRLIGVIAKSVDDSIHATQLIEQLILSQLDSSSFVRRNTADFIMNSDFRKSQFTSTAIDSLYLLLLPENREKLDEMNILLIGFIGSIDKCDSLYSYAEKKLSENLDIYSKNQFYTLIWSSKLALARMGDRQLALECVGFMRNYINDIMQFRIICRHASYIRTIDAIDFFNELLNVNLITPPLKPSSKGEPIAKVALEYLQRIVNGIPIPKEYRITIDQIETAREWMKVNKGKYIINEEVFW